MSHLHSYTGHATPAVESPFMTIAEGNPVATTRLNYQSADGKFLAGRWTSTEGVYQVKYTDWEWIRLISGSFVLEPSTGGRFEYNAGDYIVIEPGFEGRWTVTAALEKDFVIGVMAPAAV